MGHNFINQRGMQHHLLVHMHPKIEVSIMARIRRTSRLGQPSPKIVSHKEVVGLLYVVDLVKPTLVNLVMARQVVSSVVKRVTS